MGTLAFVLFVALALLNTMRGKEPETRASAPAKGPKTEVVIGDFSFSPKTLTVPVGATVTWTNHDNVPHLVTTANISSGELLLKQWRVRSRRSDLAAKVE
jgi:plastocyanin